VDGHRQQLSPRAPKRETTWRLAYSGVHAERAAPVARPSHEHPPSRCRLPRKEPFMPTLTHRMLAVVAVTITFVGACSAPTEEEVSSESEALRHRWCGNGRCDGSETCSSCPRDCGTCPTAPRCGDLACNGTETCSSCPGDCGACPTAPRCGDLTC